jgi:peptidyl-tRNA hydrolase
VSEPGGDGAAGVNEPGGDGAAGVGEPGGHGSDWQSQDGTSAPGGDGAAGIDPSGAALAPLRARYADWLGLDREQVLADRDEDPERIRALQLVLRMERDRPPDFDRALELAARGCAALCLDPRSEPGGEWYAAVHDYCTGHIRKVTRRARAGHWDAVAELPGITLTDGDTQVRALLPGLLSELDKRVSRLQVGGTDVPRNRPAGQDEPRGQDERVGPDKRGERDESAPPLATGALVLHPAPALPMTLGKSMAQAGHAGMIAAALLAGGDPAALGRWYRAGPPVAARPVGTERWQQLVGVVADPAAAWREHQLLAVRDAGFTEIEPGTVTMVAAIAPPRAR